MHEGIELINCEVLNAMELNTKLNQAACCDAPGNLLHTIEGAKLDNESRHCVNGKQETSQELEAVLEMADSNLAPTKLDTEAVNMLNGEYCGLFTQLSIEYVDIFEILREEILAAEARELEVDGLLNAGEEEFEEPPSFESTFVKDCKMTGIDKDRPEGLECTSARDAEESGTGRDDYQDDAQNSSLHNIATDVAHAALILQKSEDGQAELRRSPSTGLVEDSLNEVEEMGAEDKNAAPSADDKAGFEYRLKAADVREMGLPQAHQVSKQVELLESSSTPRELSFEQACQIDDKVDHEETLPPSNVEGNGNGYLKEDERKGTEKGKDTLLDSSKRDDGDHLLQNEMSDKLSEYSEDDDYTSGPFSGPMAFSGMLSYSGLIPYSGQIPHSGNISLHSDSSTSTRSFAFPILASDWNSSPAKIGQPDSRYFRRRRRWRPRFCCRRPTTLFD